VPYSPLINVDMRKKSLIWFWYLESVGCINEAKEATRYVQYRLTWSTHTMLILIHTQNSPTPCHLLQDYECRDENKGTDLVLIPRKFGV
jgi:hypothetical protein